MYLPVLAIALLSLLCDSQVQAAAELTFKVTPSLVVVENITEELTLACHPNKDVDKEGNIALMIDIFRHDDIGDATFVARQRIKSKVIDDERISAEGHLRTVDEEKGSFLKVTVQEPTETEEGVYVCRYIYLDSEFQVQNIQISVNVSVEKIPPAKVIPEAVVVSPQVTSCGCADLREEIDILKATIVKENEKLKQEIKSYNETCRVSFSAKFKGQGSYPIQSQSSAYFSEAISNKGGAFHNSKNAFIAPCSGQYFFSLTLRSQQELDSGYVDGLIMVDNNEVARTSVFADSPVINYESATNGVVVSLAQGQEVKVKIETTSFGRLRGGYYSIFSGFFVSP